MTTTTVGTTAAPTAEQAADGGRPPMPAGAPAPAAPGGVLTRRAAATPFEVHLDVFAGPFDLLLGLISKHKLDITEIALARVTDEFIAHIRAAQDADGEWDLSQASEFLVVAATLLDIKAARLLPASDEPDDEDLALIEARDLLFARLLQYRAYKQIAAAFTDRMHTHGRITPREVALEPHFACLLPELVMTVTPEQLAVIAARALTPKAPPAVGLTHLHAPAVSVREQAGILADRLRTDRQATFAQLVADAGSTLVVVARFLALLELFKERRVALDQDEALGALTVRWTAGLDADDEGAGDMDDVGGEVELPTATGDPDPGADGAAPAAEDTPTDPAKEDSR